MLINLSTGKPIAIHVVMCDTFWRKLRGLMFRRALEMDTALIFVGRSESIVDASIHMFFVFFPIAVLWLDAQRRVIDTALARPFRPYYAPCAPAQYFVECAPSVLDQVGVGDELAFDGKEEQGL